MDFDKLFSEENLARLLKLPHQSVLLLDWIISMKNKHSTCKISSEYRLSKNKIEQKFKNYVNEIILNAAQSIENDQLKIGWKNSSIWFVKCLNICFRQHIDHRSHFFRWKILFRMLAQKRYWHRAICAKNRYLR